MTSTATPLQVRSTRRLHRIERALCRKAWSLAMTWLTRANSTTETILTSRMITSMAMTRTMMMVHRKRIRWIYPISSRWSTSRRRMTRPGWKKGLCASTPSRCSSSILAASCSGLATSQTRRWFGGVDSNLITVIAWSAWRTRLQDSSTVRTPYSPTKVSLMSQTSSLRRLCPALYASTLSRTHTTVYNAIRRFVGRACAKSETTVLSADTMGLKRVTNWSDNC